jgi:hypothetical protein
MARSTFSGPTDPMSPPHARGRLDRNPASVSFTTKAERSMSNNDEYVGRFSEGDEVLGSEGEEVLGEDDPEKHRMGSFADEDLLAAVQRSRVLEAS